MRKDKIYYDTTNTCVKKIKKNYLKGKNSSNLL